MSSTLLKPDKPYRRSVIDMISVLLKKSRQNESGRYAISICGIIEYNDGTYEEFGSMTSSRSQTVGRLMDLVFTRLKQD